MRPPVDDIAAPPFPRGLPWINAAPLRMDQQRGQPVLVEFIDHCRPESLRSLPYLQGLHERHAGDGLRVIAVHTSGFGPLPRPHDPEDAEQPDATGEARAAALEPFAGPDAVESAAERLGLTMPIVADLHYDIWELYGNSGWPARYLWNREGILVDAHHGTRGHAATERAVLDELGVDGDPVAALRPEDDGDIPLGVCEPDNQAGPYNGDYVAGAVWAVLAGRGEISINGEQRSIDYDGCHLLVEHGHHTRASLQLKPIGPGLGCHATIFTPGALGPA
jgi:hypothetical protein